MSKDSDEVEEKCLDAEAWADELHAWCGTRKDGAAASEASALAAMLRALVKSIRLSLIAEGDPEDRGYLVEELESTLAMSRKLASGGSSSDGSSGGSSSDLPIPSDDLPAVPTADLPAVPASSRGPASRPGEPRIRRDARMDPVDDDDEPAPATIRPFDKATVPPPEGLDPLELFERAPYSDKPRSRR